MTGVKKRMVLKNREAAGKNLISKNRNMAGKMEMEKLFRFMNIFLAVIPFLAGLYFEYFSCLAGIVLFGYLIYEIRRQECVYFRLNDASMAVIVLVVFYGISIVFAVDRGMALWGMFKFFPLFPFLLLLLQMDRGQRLLLMKPIPFAGSAMVVLSCILLAVPFLRNFLLVNGRLGGFFQYPNTFAMYLLIGLIVLYAGDLFYERQRKVILTVLLLGGIFLSGSRTVAGLTLAAAICLIWFHRAQLKWMDRSRRRLIVILFLLIAAAGLGILLGYRFYLSGGTFFGDPGRSSLSTFWGRLLYFQDALGQIAKHPFGLGYMGYYLTQGEFQTGVYSVMFVHNDWLQILLDVGWIPAFFMLLALIKALISKGQFATQKMVLVFFILHGMFDFDLQYLCMFFLLILALDLEAEKQYSLRMSAISSGALGVLGFLAIAGSLYIGLGNFTYYIGNIKLSCQIYPANTFAKLRLLTEVETAEELEVMADDLLVRNEKLALAWNAKAKAAYSKGDFAEVITAKKKAMALEKYNMDTYEDYFTMLADGAELYEASGDEQSAEICRMEIKNIQTVLDEVIGATSPFAWKTVDEPQLEMSAEYQYYVEQMEK